MKNNTIRETAPCPVCKDMQFPKDDFPGSFNICTLCGWEDDNVQYDDQDYEGGANDLSLNQYKEAYWKMRAKNEK